MWRGRGGWLVARYVLVWVVVAVPLFVVLFLRSSTEVTVASHDAEISPTLDGYATVHTGPFLPDIRADSGSRVGVDVQLGKTEADSTEGLVQRYAFIASQPDPQIKRVRDAVEELAWDSAVRAGLYALAPPLCWILVGRRRRRELVGETTPRRAVFGIVAAGAVIAVVVTVAQRPWISEDQLIADDTTWISLQDFIPEIDVPEEARGIEIQGNLATSGSRRLVMSAVDTYHKSRAFYADAEEKAEDLELRQPEEDETVAIIVSDRHDNIGMDPVARAVADQAGATAVLDAGDDTSTGETWEAFSLDSLNDAFEDLDRYAVQGNHDHGSFVEGYLGDRGWQTASREVVEGPGDSRLVLWNDPRSSGLGTWRDTPGKTVPETAADIADVVCGAEERVNTLLVHDADMGTAALQLGCVDLVISGHLHTQVGPKPVVGLNKKVGYTYTNGTTGGAAYAIAVGSKLRRPAEMTLVTYRDGRPVGLQPVTLATNGVFHVADYIELAY